MTSTVLAPNLGTTVTIPISSVRHSSENLQYATIVAVPYVGIPTMNDVTPPVCL